MHPTQEKKPEVNFINLLQAAFTHADPKSAKKTVKLSVFFTLLGSASAKATHRSLMKLTPGADAIKKFTPSFGIPNLGV
jgi:hypothetical protein